MFPSLTMVAPGPAWRRAGLASRRRAAKPMCRVARNRRAPRPSRPRHTVLHTGAASFQGAPSHLRRATQTGLVRWLGLGDRVATLSAEQIAIVDGMALRAPPRGRRMPILLVDQTPSARAIVPPVEAVG